MSCNMDLIKREFDEVVSHDIIYIIYPEAQSNVFSYFQNVHHMNQDFEEREVISRELGLTLLHAMDVNAA